MTSIDYNKIVQPLLQAIRFILSKKGLKGSNIEKKTAISVKLGVISVLMPDYADFTDEGRKPGGKMPPIKDLLKWIRRKNIKLPDGFTQEGFAFAVARKIAKDGTEGKDFLSAIRVRIFDLIADYTSKQLDNKLKQI